MRMTRYKIAFVTHLSNLSGANKSLLDLLDGLDYNIFDPLVIINSHGPLERELEGRSVKYKVAFYSPSTNSTNKFKNIVKYVLNSSVFNRISVSILKKIFKEENIQLVHNNSYLVSVGMQAAYETNIPYICHLRDFIWEDHHRKFFNESKQIKLLKNANLNLAVSQSVANKFQKNTSNKIEVLFDGIKVEDYILDSRQLFTDNEVNIIMAGRISEGKAQLDSIKAVEKVNQYYGEEKVLLHIVGGVGNEQYYKSLHDYVEEHKLSCVRFHKFMLNLKEFRNQCDIGLTCSTNEAMGRVTVENMLASLLVIGNNAAGTSEIIVDQENGMLYNNSSVDELAETIIFAIENPEKSNLIAKKGRDSSIENFSLETYSSQIEEIYKKILRA